MIPTPLHRRAMMRFISIVLGAYFGMYHHWRVEGLEHIPPRGPLLIATNHVSALDIPLGGTLFVRQGWVAGENLWAVGKKELFVGKKIQGAILQYLGMFPLDREHIDLSAMRSMLRILKRGGLLGIAPEGTRSQDGRLLPFRAGVAKLAISLRTPILPIGLIGTFEALPPGAKFPRPRPILIRIGKPFELSEFYDRELEDEDLERAAFAMRSHIAELLPTWMRGDDTNPQTPPALAQASGPVHQKHF